MRALIQCVKKASVKVEDKIVGKIDRGYLIFLGVGTEDGPEEVEKLWNKINKLRIWEDDQGKTNWNLEKIGGSCLIVSQFTPVSYTHLTLPTILRSCRSRWSPYH